MAFTAQELANIANSVLEFHIRGQPLSQVLQDRPLFNDLMRGKKSFPGGNEYITQRVKGVYTTSVQGYSHDDEQVYNNPANIKQSRAKWYELGGGITVTHTELKVAGITVNSTNGAQTSQHSDSELTNLCNLLDDKFEDLNEGFRRSFAEMLWRDGTQDAKAVPGLQSFILTSPSTGTTFGIDRAANSWWRNRASVSIDSTTASNNNLVNTLQEEFRQLRRYATGAKHKMYAGSTFISRLEKELRSKGTYTDNGWNNRQDAAMGDLAFKGVPIQYDPVLDDLSLERYCYVVDHNAIKLMPMEQEEFKMHTPERPPEKYVMYRALTWTGALCAQQLNSTGVYAVTS